MSMHPESEQLSAFVDGELTEREQVSVEAHVASCAECRGLLAALRATVGDLAALEQPEMDPQASWAIRKAVSRERRLGGRSRWVWASSAAAASVVAVLAFVLIAKGGGPDGAASRGPTDTVFAGGNYDAQSAQAELDRLASGGTYDYNIPEAAGAQGAQVQAPAPSPKSVQRDSAKVEAYAAQSAYDEQTGRDVDRCDRAVRAAGSDVRRVHVIVATYERKPALLLFYEAPVNNPQRIELWVVRRDSCDVLLFRQKRI